MSFEDNKTEMPDNNYNEFANSRSNETSNVNHGSSSNNERNTDNSLTQIVRGTRTSTSRALLLALALIATTTGCQFGPDRAGPSVKITTSEQADKELECLRREFERTFQIRDNKERNTKMTELMSKRNILLEENNIPEGTETWYKSFGSQEPNHLKIEVNTTNCKKPNCEIVPPGTDREDMEDFPCKDNI